jgi:hypothetical protein
VRTKAMVTLVERALGAPVGSFDALLHDALEADPPGREAARPI